MPSRTLQIERAVEVGLARYAPFGTFLASGYSRWPVRIGIVAVCLFLLYGFLGLHDVGDIINYAFVVPAYVLVGSSAIAGFARALAAASIDIPDTLHRRRNLLRPIFGHRPAYQFMTFGAPFASVVAQLLYIYFELGFGEAAPRFRNYTLMTSQTWVIPDFPLLFFVVYIAVQFVLLWFGIIAAWSLLDELWTIAYLRSKAGARKLNLAQITRLQRDFVAPCENALTISLLLVVNSITYAQNITRERTTNLVLFVGVAAFIAAGALFIIVTFARLRKRAIEEGLHSLDELPAHAMSADEAQTEEHLQRMGEQSFLSGKSAAFTAAKLIASILGIVGLFSDVKIPIAYRFLETACATLRPLLGLQ